MKTNKKKLTKRELDVISILWNSDTPLVASEICSRDSELNINTVQTAINSLLKKEMIAVADIVYSGTVLSRCYKPLVSSEEYFSNMLQQIFPQKSGFSLPSFVVGLIDNLDNRMETIEELEQLLEEKKKELKKEGN